LRINGSRILEERERFTQIQINNQVEDLDKNKNTNTNTTINTNLKLITNTNTINPFEIFNDNILRNIGLINIYLLKPVYESLKINFENTMFDSLEFFKLVYIIIISICISGVLFIYIIIWRQFENRLNITVKFIILNFN
jgi:hypothetical protein